MDGRLRSLDFLISDTLFDNTVEPAPEIPEIQAKRRLEHPAASGGTRAHAAVAPTGAGQQHRHRGTDTEVILRNTIVAESGGQENCEGEVFGLDKSGYNLDLQRGAEENRKRCPLDHGASWAHPDPAVLGR